MAWKKHIVLGLTVTLMTSLLAGCGSESEKTEKKDTTQIVQVTKIDGKKITANIGEMSEDRGGKKPDGYGQPDAMPSGKPDNSSSDNNTAPDKPSNDSNSDGNIPPPRPSDNGNSNGSDANSSRGENIDGGQNKSDGEPPSGGPGGGRFTASGDEITFTITDSTEITSESKDGSSEAATEDIAENSILEITLDSNNQASKVVIKNFPDKRQSTDSEETANSTDA